MIEIGKPFIEKIDNLFYLRSDITADYLGGIKSIYFSVEDDYGKYLVDEVCDAFLLATLLPAVKFGENIHISGSVSERLLFHARHTISFILKAAYNGHSIKITSDKVIQTDFEGSGVGCGCSLGIDSLAAIYTHLNIPDTPDYNITHLTYFNVGSHGYKDAEANRRSFEKDVKAVKAFASKVNLPLVKIESNVWELFPGFNFDQSGNLINMSTVLTMQKLFGRYLYGSNYPITAAHLTDKCSGYFETMMIPVCSTESTELIVANGDLARSDKTVLVSKQPLSYEALYVCWKELIVNNNPNHPIAKIKNKYLNCTRCDKCLRTCVQLDILGVLDKYSKIFDLEYYRKVKDSYIGKAIAFKQSNEFYRDIVDMANTYNFKIPYKSKLIAMAYKYHLMGLYYRIKTIILR